MPLLMDPLEQTLSRLKRERDEADRRYNDALTALDRALPAPADWPAAPPAVDDSQLAALNSGYETLVAPPRSSGWRGRLSGFIWRIVAPSLERQLHFNARLVDHLNRTVAAARAAQQHAEATAAALRAESARLAQYHGRTIQYLQQVTAYIDTRDRDAASGAMVVNAALSGLAENVDKRWESAVLREQRSEARVAALAAALEEARTQLSVTRQATMALKREIELLPSRSGEAAARPAAPAPPPASADAFAAVDSYKYVGFEDQFRGSRDVIRARLESYLPVFRGAADVLDIGCGRGEFLELLAAAGVSARGIDVNHEMVEQCRGRGLDVVEADAVGYLSALPDESLGGIFAAQVVEHLRADYLLRFLDLAFHKLRPGGRLVLETLNPACWIAFFESFIRDITHEWPLHPETLKYLVLASGFAEADIEFRAPIPPQDRLQTIALPPASGAAVADLVETFNANVEKLNARIYTHLDYAVIGRR
jgi:SAM-dependent methyltransferase